MSCSCGCCGPSLEKPCGCCAGVEAVTPLPTANRPGLDALVYRVGTHATFLETMQGRLSSLYLDVPTGEVDENGPVLERVWPLRQLTVRTPDDPSIALLDGWALVADVLTFYQERIANEGYLRTAQERRSVLELARLVGYELRPGVAASVYLAFTIEKGYDIVLPAGTKAQSVPSAPGELPQTFETADKLRARDQWNVLKPRTMVPQTLEDVAKTLKLYLKGRSTGLKPNDPIHVTDGGEFEFYRVLEATPDPNPIFERTLVRLRGWQDVLSLDDFEARVRGFVKGYRKGIPPGSIRNRVFGLLGRFLEAVERGDPPKQVREEYEPRLEEALTEARKRQPNNKSLIAWLSALNGEFPKLFPRPATAVEKPEPVGGFFDRLVKAPSIPPPSSTALKRSVSALFGHNADGPVQALTLLRPRLKDNLYEAFRSVPPSEPGLRVYGVHEAAVFGYNAPSIKFVGDREVPILWPSEETHDTIYLDGTYDGVRVGGFVKVQKEGLDPQDFEVLEASTQVRRAYGASGKVTRLRIAGKWVEDQPTGEGAPLPFDDKTRETVVLLPLEELATAEAPREDRIGGGEIDLDGLSEGLEAGRWLVVAGDRDVGGIHVATEELAMLDGVEQPDINDAPDPDAGPARSKLNLAPPGLAYRYFPETVTIYANVARATHGETRGEVLGSGDGSKALQEFPLRQPPLTYVSAPTVSGADSTLRARVNDVLWHDTDTIAGLGPRDRRYLIKTQDDGNTSVIFGDGKRGARLPTGVENVKAVYRSGIGRPGNVDKNQISQLGAKPLGLKAVNNPLRASGGADRDGPTEGRRNAPLVIRALDRLVSVQDYSDFARLFAGVGKAVAARVTDGRRQLVHVTIAGAADIPIETTSDLYKNLLLAFGRYGDPFQPVQLDIREVLLLLLSARVRVLPDYLFELVEPKIRAAVLAKFSFDNRDFGQDALLSEAMAAMQAVEGVDEVDVDVFGYIPARLGEGSDRHTPTPDEIASHVQGLLTDQAKDGPLARVPVFSVQDGTDIRPAEIAYFSPDLPDTLVLAEWTS
jgi:hypothetical protein